MSQPLTRPDSGISGKHLVRYGTPADQACLVGAYLSHYEQLVLNANIVAHAPGALASFILQRAKKKPFLIDPQTHAFQHDLEFLRSSSAKAGGALKKSVTKLASRYGNAIRLSVIEKQSPVTSNLFAEPSAIRELVNGVIDFQLNQLESYREKSEVAKYFKFLEKKGLVSKAGLAPTVLVAPYFHLSMPNWKDWLDINLRAARLTLKASKHLGQRCAVEVCIDKAVLDNSKIANEIAAQYADLMGVATFLVWVDKFDEHEESQERLIALGKFLRALSVNTKCVNLFGGYFSVALCKLGLVAGLAAVCHGLEYGESRNVVPVGGGLPLAKYYFRPLHKRLNSADAVRAIRLIGGFKSDQIFYERVCSCRQCKATIRSRPEVDFARFTEQKQVRVKRNGRTIARAYSTRSAKDASVRHYLWCRASEYSSAITHKQVVTRLLASANKFMPLGPEVMGHCERWVHALNKLQADLVKGG